VFRERSCSLCDLSHVSHEVELVDERYFGELALLKTAIKQISKIVVVRTLLQQYFIRFQETLQRFGQRLERFLASFCQSGTSKQNEIVKMQSTEPLHQCPCISRQCREQKAKALCFRSLWHASDLHENLQNPSSSFCLHPDHPYIYIYSLFKPTSVKQNNLINRLTNADAPRGELRPESF
jgi:hypothetical protein